MDIDGVGMDTAEDGKIEVNGSPITNFDGAVCFPAHILHLMCVQMEVRL